MDSDKKELGAWWMWVLLLVVISGVIFTGLNYAGMIGKTVVERKVFEESYQRSEGLKQQTSVYEAQLAELNSRLNSTNIDVNTRSEIESQISSIKIQLNAARSRQ